MAKTKPDHVARAMRAWPLLVERATTPNGEAFTYGEISHLIGEHHRAARWFMDVIQRYCDAQGPDQPPLQAFAVNARTRLPGQGYHGSKRERKVHKAMMEKARDFPWPEAPDLSPYKR